MLGIKLKAYLSEKSNTLAEDQKVTVLNLGPNLNKIQFKQYFMTAHNIKIDAVNALTKPSKKRRRGKVTGKTVARQKVILTVSDSAMFEKLKTLL